jgi:hypothetical protein
MSAPERLCQVRVLVHTRVRALPLHPLHPPADRHLRGIETNRWTWSLDTCSFRMSTSSARRTRRIASRTRSPVPRSAQACGISSSKRGADGPRIRCAPRAGTPCRLHPTASAAQALA